MKRLLFLAFLIESAVLLSSCETTSSFTVSYDKTKGVAVTVTPQK